MRKVVKRTGLVVLMIGLLFFIVISLRVPSLSRSWDEDVSVLAGVTIADAKTVSLTHVRDWHYALESIVSKEYFDASFDPTDIVDLWLYEQELDAAGLIAHTFLVFEFDASYGRGRYLGLSVETRRERGEEYSIIGGTMRAFEITHIWATEEDLVRRRVQYLDYPLTRYRLNIPADTRSRIFVKFAEETQSLASEPRWYNTAMNNCTSSLIRYVNESEPGAIPLHYSYTLTGKVDDYLERLGFKSADYALHVTRDFLASNELR